MANVNMNIPEQSFDLGLPEEYVYTRPPYVPSAASLSYGTNLLDWFNFCRLKGWTCELPAGIIYIDQPQLFEDFDSGLMVGAGARYWRGNKERWGSPDWPACTTAIIIEDQYTEQQYINATNAGQTLNFWDGFTIDTTRNLRFENIAFRRDNGPIFRMVGGSGTEVVSFTNCSFYGSGGHYLAAGDGEFNTGEVTFTECSFSGFDEDQVFLERSALKYYGDESLNYKFFACRFKSLDILEDFVSGGGNTTFYSCSGEDIDLLAKVGTISDITQPIIECYGCVWSNSNNTTILIDTWAYDNFAGSKISAVFSGGRVECSGPEGIVPLVRIQEGNSTDITFNSFGIIGHECPSTPMTPNEWEDYRTLI